MTSRSRHGERGLTLPELLVVLLILALVAAFAVPQLMRYVGGARADAAAIQINRLEGILDLYRLDNNRYPTTEEGLEALIRQPADAPRWNGPYVRNEEALIDPWGRPYGYASPGEHGDVDLYSLGADGSEGGEDEDADITNW